MRKPIFEAIVLLVVASSTVAAEDMTKTNSSDPFSVETRYFSHALRSPPETNGFWADALDRMHRNKISVDRLGPFAHQSLYFSEFSGYAVWKNNISLGRSVIVDTVVDGFRDSAGDNIPYEAWLESWSLGTNSVWARAIVQPVSSFFVGLIDGTLGNTEERELKFGLPTTSEIAISRWRQLENQYALKYGVHGSYGYFNAKLGSVCYLDTRLEATFPGLSVSALTRVLRLSGQLVFPVNSENRHSNGRLIVGGSLYPEEYISSSGFDRANYGPSFGVRYEHDLFVHGSYCGSGSLGWSENVHGRLFAFQYAYSF